MDRHLVHVVSSVRWGTVEKYTFDICRAMRDAGVHVTMLTRDARAVDANFAAEGLSLWHAPVGHTASIHALLTMRTLLSSSPLGTVVHVHTPADAALAIMSRRLSRRPDIRIVATHHQRLPKFNRALLLSHVFPHLDAHIFPSLGVMQSFSSRLSAPGPGGDPAAWHLVPYSVLTDPTPVSLDAPKGPVTAMLQGEIVDGTGIETVIDALALLGKTRLRLKIVGTGNPDYLDALRRRAMTRGVMERIDWIRSTDRYCALVPECHFGVSAQMVSSAPTIVNKEFMAFARPQLCTAMADQREYLTDGREAFFFSPGDAPRLAERFKLLAEDPLLRLRMSHAALDRFHSAAPWPRTFEALAEIYRFKL